MTIPLWFETDSKAGLAGARRSKRKVKYMDQRAKKYGVMGDDAIETGVGKLIDTIEALEKENQKLATTLSRGVVWNEPSLPSTDAERKAMPIGTGCLDYFPLALAEVARVSKVGNDKHNPGEPLHWARNKSTDQANPIIRHWLQRGKIDPSNGMRHSANMAWRALALLQTELELAQGYDAVKEATQASMTSPLDLAPGLAPEMITFTEGTSQPRPAPKRMGGQGTTVPVKAVGDPEFLEDEEWLQAWNPSGLEQGRQTP